MEPIQKHMHDHNKLADTWNELHNIRVLLDTLLLTLTEPDYINYLERVVPHKYEGQLLTQHFPMVKVTEITHDLGKVIGLLHRCSERSSYYYNKAYQEYQERLDYDQDT